ncbi:coenzyme F420-0:L-glutamate ligase [Thalassolituus sp. LLYu03]|uniref:coenzyme F420-0:L-glutamate ligase n=1 Tax=Thalassolituus sp. LLYu03 TaxID=3421656 RepID=UPI003D28F097
MHNTALPDMSPDNGKQPLAFPAARMEMLAPFGLPDFQPGDDLAGAFIQVLSAQNMHLHEGDILVIAHKVVSKCEGAVADIEQVEPSEAALKLAAEVNKDPRKVEIILRESKQILRAVKRPGQPEGILIAEHRLGFICANAAVDQSNADNENQLIFLPQDPDASARSLCQALEAHFNCRLGVIISDTFGRPWRLGQTNVAVGIANVPALVTMYGDTDAWGRELKVTAPAFADELAGASGLLMSKAGKCPLIIFRGLCWQSDAHASAADLLRPSKEDLFK